MMAGNVTRAENRSGEYIPQVGGYRAFVPAPLLPHPTLDFDGEMQALLSRADRALGRLDGSIQTLPDPDLFVLMYVRKEAVLSSRIEGTQSSLNDVLEVEAKVFDSQRPSDVKEVLNYVAAMNHGLDRLQQLPLSVRLIKEIHQRLMQGVRGKDQNPGEFRAKQNWIGPAGCSLQEATFVPPPPSQVQEALADFERFLHAEAPAIPALIKIGLGHAQFETIHPFLDGNGRVGRLLITFFLCEQRILTKPVLYISHYFRQNQQKYYDLLQATRDQGDWEGWLKFFVSGVAEVSDEATETARRIVSLRESHRRFITENFGRAAGNGLIVLEHLFKRPIIQVNEIADLLGISFAGANGIVRKFVDAGLLSESTGKARNRRFRYGEYIGLFSNA